MKKTPHIRLLMKFILYSSYYALFKTNHFIVELLIDIKHNQLK